MISDSEYDGDTTQDHLAFISKDLLDREQRYKQRNDEIGKKTSSLLQETQLAVKDGFHLLEQATAMPTTSFATRASTVPTTLLTIQSVRPQSSAATRRPIRSAPLAGRSGAAAGTASASNPSPASITAAKRANTAKAAAAELELIEKIADRLQEAVNDPSHDYTLEATNRYLKARLLVVEEELEKVSQETRAKVKAQSSAETALKALEEAHKKLQKQHHGSRYAPPPRPGSGFFKLTHDSANQTAHDKLATQLTTADQRAATAESALAALQRDMSSLKKAEKSTTSEVHARELKLNRAQEECERLRALMAKSDQDRKDQVDKLKRANDRLAAEIKRLEKQKGELMTGSRNRRR
ncbi:hypothetical protein BCR44DRAFT_1500758 [Catenaria anguillulae PL171]|uniref:Uncharacterized protein n=1 Tax=Catenaria anguillulae PL171 TaxID=765915 RepID=A0A1Y2HJP0_9FUNG|nr:hypothetical protein BCR44DRAFT_1500758 [Catenaria anguillulae PL171]